MLSSTCKTPMVLTQPSRNVSRLLLLLLLLRPSRASFYTMSIATTLCPQSYGFHIPVLSTCLLFALSKLCTPIKSILNLQHTCGDQSTFNLLRSCVQFRILLVEVGGFAPPSRTLFSLLHTAITNIIIHSYVNHVMCKCV